MAIDPSSDIVLDVIRAADPQRAAASAQRLYALANAQAPSPANFAAALDQSAPTSAPVSALSLNAANARARLVSASPAATSGSARAATEFEALLLNDFVSEMLPKQSSAVFGQGLSGDMWKSMLADQVSRQIARSGALGIGKKLFATHALTGHGDHVRDASGVGAASAPAAQMSVNALSSPADLPPGASDSIFADGSA